MDREDLPKHPSHGLLKLSRVSGGWNTRFFGSAASCGHYVMLELHEGEESFDRVSGSHFYDGKIVVRCRMTATQFAEAITTMNRGSGTPVTFEHLRTGPLERVEDPPKSLSEAMRIREAFQKEVGEKLAALGSMKRRILSHLEKVGGARRREIERELEAFFRLFEDSAPFMMGTFEEATEQAVQDAKANVSAFVDSALREAGLAALAAGPAPVTLELGEKSGEDRG